MGSAVPVLAQSKWFRFGALCLLYFCQGLPIGLFQVAIPAWFAAQGLTLAQVGGFIAIVFLPWSFKLLAGPIMDRFAFPPMGRRRPWVLLAQLGIVATFIVLALLSPDPNESYMLLATLGFVANAFGAFQDVAVDGMAIDVLEEDERAQANAYMFGGQIVGTSIAGAAGSAALVSYGLTAASLIMAFTVLMIMMVPLFLREREGERILPWTQGEASPEALVAVNESWKDIFSSLIRALILPMSVLLIFLEGFQRMAAGMLVSIGPVMTVQDLGWAQTDWSNYYATAGIIASVVAVVLGPLIDRIGSFRVLTGAIAFRLVLFAAFALTSTYWQHTEWVQGMVLLAYISSQIVTVTIIALFMRLCLKRVSATQFAVYMASANLTYSMGSGAVAPLGAFMDYQGMFLVMAGLHLAFLLLLPLMNFERHERDNEMLEARLART
ncbi:MAG: MFS transporter [Pseudomonadales bacterium]|jgi:PAT family beta-lactamase induction signal transducer AmpG|nr:MFS transporter [Pseudomonadales bacterium]